MLGVARPHRGAHRGMGEVERLCRTGDVLAFGDGDEDAELIEGHEGLNKSIE